MEVLLKKTSKSGKVYRIVKEVPAWELFTIEFLKVGKCLDGSDYRAWFPAFEPKNKVFGSLSECMFAFEAFLQT